MCVGGSATTPRHGRGHGPRLPRLLRAGPSNLSIGEEPRNAWSGVVPEHHAIVITGKMELICTPIHILQAIDVNIMLSNEGIEINAVMFNYFRNTVVYTDVVIKRTHQL